MKRCPITYKKIAASENYSQRGLHLLSPQLKDLHPLLLSADVMNEIQRALPNWQALLKVSFMSQAMKEKYLALLKKRSERLELFTD
ncbi:MAG: hypothetical protein A3E82_08345 [Gammaproteobacteria bacterium RIFCSPHIGHO2_12_FULL_38_11]|nr:MAG: hypothetical protein A3E82_08345 [Gammaproteobacteria bacterium RIFCSPHIGHO2_12_FULL_38_11]